MIGFIFFKKKREVSKIEQLVPLRPRHTITNWPSVRQRTGNFWENLAFADIR